MAKRVEGEGGGDIVSAIVDNEAAVATSTEGRHVRRMPSEDLLLPIDGDRVMILRRSAARHGI